MLAIEVIDIWKKYQVDFQRKLSFRESFLNFRRIKSDFWALRGISLEVHKGQSIGIIGGNGSGKTTLLRIILGITRPTRGKIKVCGRLAGLLELGAGFHQELTGRENVYLNGSVLGLKRKEIKRHLDSIVDFADIGEFINAPVRTYSSGMYLRLGFAIAVHLEPEILIIDEVLAVGDDSFQKKCLKKIKELSRKGVTLVIVSHHLNLIEQYVQQVFCLNAGSILFSKNNQR